MSDVIAQVQFNVALTDKQFSMSREIITPDDVKEFKKADLAFISSVMETTADVLITGMTPLIGYMIKNAIETGNMNESSYITIRETNENYEWVYDKKPSEFGGRSPVAFVIVMLRRIYMYVNHLYDIENGEEAAKEFEAFTHAVHSNNWKATLKHVMFQDPSLYTSTLDMMDMLTPMMESDKSFKISGVKRSGVSTPAFQSEIDALTDEQRAALMSATGTMNA